VKAEGQQLRVMVVTVSDRAEQGTYEDKSGPLTESIVGPFLQEKGFRVAGERKLVPDDSERIRTVLGRAVADGVDLVLTTGGTGIGPRDVTPEATMAVLEKEIPGIMAAVRARYRDKFPAALLSRAVAGVSGRTLVVNLPGSEKAVTECLDVILPVIPHALEMIAGGDSHPE
jgi:molybdenum cofactor biosynthesis protein B